MIKQLILLIHFVSLFFYQIFFTSGVSVKQEIPSSMAPGSEVTVSLVINKSDVTGFAKIQQKLPVGFSAEVMDSKGATFSFKDQKMKMIWMSLPTEEEFTITYKLKASESTSGNFTIAGMFSYISESERKNIEVTPATVIVEAELIVDNTSNDEAVDQEAPAIDVSEEIIVEGTNTEAQLEPEKSAVLATAIKLNRRIEELDGGKYKVIMNVEKENINGFAKITELIPDGFIASVDQTEGGIFSFKEQQVKIIWLTLPEKDEFTISYMMEAVSSSNGEYAVNGNIAYLDNDITKRYDAEPTSLTLNIENEIVMEEQVENNQEDTETVIEEAVTSNIEGSLNDKIQSAMGVNNEEVEEAEEVALNEVVKEEAETLKEKVEVVEEISTTEVAEVKDADMKEKVEEELKKEDMVTDIADITSVTAPETGVAYKVQIAALRKQLPTQVISKKFKISKSINIESHEGWSKYIVGSHNVYKEARDERNEIRKNVKQAFVTAYNQGERITVQEALMISNQKWYK